MNEAGHLGVAGADEALLESFESFYVREYRAILTLALALTRNRTEAEDVTQDSFLAAYKAWERIATPSAWIRVAVTNRAMSGWRRTASGARALLRLGPVRQSTDLPEDTDHFWSEVCRLPKRQAQAIAYYYLEDRSTEEIAMLLGCDPGTVRIHLSRGRRALAKRVEADL